MLLTYVDMVCVTRTAGVSWNVPVSALLKGANIMWGGWTNGYRSCCMYSLSCFMNDRSRSFSLLSYAFTNTPTEIRKLRAQGRNDHRWRPIGLCQV
jgi:hypothetical protein